MVAALSPILYAVDYPHTQSETMPYDGQYGGNSESSEQTSYDDLNQPFVAASPPSFKRKMSISSETCCDLCHYPDPILRASTCNHVFHSRCVHIWPLQHCPVCDIVIPHLCILPICMEEPIPIRHGKWTMAEIAFIDMMLSEFNRDFLPLANGTPMRLVLAKLLNCSTMRVSKKFQKNALGKQTFRVRKPPSRGAVVMKCSQEMHQSRQMAFSRVEEVFRQELANNPRDEGGLEVMEQLRKAVKQFWVANFLKFAVVVGQLVEGIDISNGRKRKMVMDMLRQGQYQPFLRPLGMQTLLELSQPVQPVHTQPKPIAYPIPPLTWMEVRLHPTLSHYDQDLVEEHSPNKRQRTLNEPMQWPLKNSQLPTPYEQLLYDDHQQQSVSQQAPTPTTYDYSITSLYNSTPNHDQSVSSPDHYTHYSPSMIKHVEEVHSPQAHHPVHSYPSSQDMSMNVYPVRPYPEYRGPISSVTMSRSIILDESWVDFLDDDMTSNPVDPSQTWSTLEIC